MIHRLPEGHNCPNQKKLINLKIPDYQISNNTDTNKKKVTPNKKKNTKYECFCCVIA